MLGFCKTAQYVAAKPIMPGLQVKPDVKLPTQPKAGELCDLCQMAINELDTMISKNSTAVCLLYCSEGEGMWSFLCPSISCLFTKKL